MIPPRGRRALDRAGWRASNQFPRAVDLAKPSCAGLPVCIGGFHISAASPCCRAAGRHQSRAGEGISFFAGEAEERRLDEVLRRRFQRPTQKPLYNYMDPALPNWSASRRRFLRASTSSAPVGNLSSIDLGRGCPYQCSFCTIINVQRPQEPHPLGRSI